MSTHARMDMRKHSFNPESASKKPNFHSDSTHQMRFRVLRNRRANPSIHHSKAHSPASSTPRPISIVQSSEPAISPSTGACMTDYTRPSYKLSADTMVSSLLLPSLNSAISKLPFSSLSIIRKIFLTRFSGVSSSGGSLTIEPTLIIQSEGAPVTAGV